MLWFAILAAAAAITLINTAQVDAAAATIHVSMFQGAITNGDVNANLALLDTLASQAAANGSHVLIVPELFNTGYIATSNTQYTVQDLIQAAPTIYRGLAETITGNSITTARNIATKYQIALVFTFLEINNSSATALPYDSVVFIDHTGQLLVHYRKIQIVANVENYFLSVGDRGFGPVVSWTPKGAGMTAIMIGLLICNDIVHPEPAEILTLLGAQLIFIPTANAAPTLNDNAVSMQYIPVRSNENGVTIVYCNYVQHQINPNLASLFSFYGGSVIGNGPTPSGLQNTPNLVAGLYHIQQVYIPPANDLEPHCPASGRDRYPQFYGMLADATECVAPPGPPPCPNDPHSSTDHVPVKLAVGLSFGLGIPAILVAYFCGRRAIMVENAQTELYSQLAR